MSFLDASWATLESFPTPEEVEKKILMNASKGNVVSIMEPGPDGFFIDPEIFNDVPEMDDQQQLIATTEAYINRLVDFSQRIKTAKGMSRGMAYEFKELVASNESFANPMMFTDAVTGIGYEPTLEAISAKMWLMIAAAVAFLVTIIYKFINWIFGNDSKSPSSLEEVKKGIQETPKKLDKQSRTVHEVVNIVKDTHGDQISISLPQAVDKNFVENSSLPDVMKKEVLKQTRSLGMGVHPNDEKTTVTLRLSDVLADLRGGQQIYDFVRKPNKYARVIYSQNSPALKLVLASFDGFKAASGIVLGQLDVIEEMMKDLSNSDGPQSLSEQLKFGNSLSVLDSVMSDKTILKFAGMEFDSALHWANELRSQIDTYGSQELPFEDLEDLLVSYEAAFHRVKHVDFNNMVHFINALKRAEPVLLKLERMANAQKQLKGLGELTDKGEERASAIMRVHRSMATNLLGLMKVYSHISRVYVEVGKHGYNIVQALTKNAAHVIAFYNKYKEHPPPTLVMLHEQLQESSNDFKENLVKEHLVAKHVNIGTVKYSFSFGDDDDDDEPAHSGTMSAKGAAELMSTLGGTKK